jgi:hypothetical protein
MRILPAANMFILIFYLETWEMTFEWFSEQSEFPMKQAWAVSPFSFFFLLVVWGIELMAYTSTNII